jgi:hypothetical protein
VAIGWVPVGELPVAGFCEVVDGVATGAVAPAGAFVAGGGVEAVDGRSGFGDGLVVVETGAAGLVEPDAGAVPVGAGAGPVDVVDVGVASDGGVAGVVDGVVGGDFSGIRGRVGGRPAVVATAPDGVVPDAAAGVAGDVAGVAPRAGTSANGEDVEVEVEVEIGVEVEAGGDAEPAGAALAGTEAGAGADAIPELDAGRAGVAPAGVDVGAAEAIAGPRRRNRCPTFSVYGAPMPFQAATSV